MADMVCDVSVILPTYNRGETLTAACESVLNQSHRSLELIVVDDGSSDDTASVVERLADPRVVYVRRDRNGGASAARNTGLEHARGRFIAFQDSDDLWLPDKLRRQIAMFDGLADDVGVVAGSKILYGRDDQRRYGAGRVTCMPPPEGRLRLDEDQARRCLVANRIGPQNSLFRRDCMGGSMHWFDPCAKANNDWEFTARLGQVTKIYEDPEPVVVAFISGDSISKRPRKKILGLLRILKNNRAALDRYPDVEAQLLIKLATIMATIGKSRISVGFLMAAARRYPTSLLGGAGAARKLVRRHLLSRPKPAARPVSVAGAHRG